MHAFAAHYALDWTSSAAGTGFPESSVYPMIHSLRPKFGACLLAAILTAATTAARVVGRVYAMNQSTVKIEVTNGPIIYRTAALPVAAPGELVTGATNAALPFTQVNATDAADYEVIITDANGPVRSRIARLTVATPQPGRLVNFSARGAPQGPGSAVIVGAVMAGGTKEVLVRGLGPSLTGFGVANAMVDPRLDVYANVNGRTTVVASNGATPVRAAFAASGAFDLPDATSRDAALIVTMPAGAFTALVSGVGGTTGEALIEVYELP